MGWGGEAHPAELGAGVRARTEDEGKGLCGRPSLRRRSAGAAGGGGVELVVPNQQHPRAFGLGNVPCRSKTRLFLELSQVELPELSSRHPCKPPEAEPRNPRVSPSLNPSEKGSWCRLGMAKSPPHRGLSLGDPFPLCKGVLESQEGLKARHGPNYAV